jgi:hypothetical protein
MKWLEIDRISLKMHFFKNFIFLLKYDKIEQN